MSEQRQNRKRERSGFAGAGLGGADKIFAGENEGKSAELNRRGLGKTHCLHAPHYFRRKIEIIERHEQQISACRSTCHSVAAFVIPSKVEESLTTSF